MPPKYAAERAALLKILLHAAAHPTATVNGVLVGKPAGRAGGVEQDGANPGSGGAGAVEILDALPLFHSYTTLAPMTEVALIEADAHARSQGLQLVGYYQANERLEDGDLGPAGRKVADRIHSHTPQACALLVDNAVLKEFARGQHPTFLQLLTRDEKRGWAPAPDQGALAGLAGVAPLFLDLWGSGRHQQLADFDDHLNDIRKDWTNPTLLQ